MKIGIENLKQMCDSLVSAGKALDTALEDGKIGLGDSMLLMRIVPDFFTTFTSLPEIAEEVEDLDEAERLELRNHFAQKFDLSDERAEELVEELFQQVITILLTVIQIRVTVKSIG